MKSAPGFPPRDYIKLYEVIPEDYLRHNQQHEVWSGNTTVNGILDVGQRQFWLSKGQHRHLTAKSVFKSPQEATLSKALTAGQSQSSDETNPNQHLLPVAQRKIHSSLDYQTSPLPLSSNPFHNLQRSAPDKLLAPVMSICRRLPVVASFLKRPADQLMLESLGSPSHYKTITNLIKNLLKVKNMDTEQ